MDYMALIQAVLASVVAGGGFSVMAAISKIKKGEKFEPSKLMGTVILGGVIGIIAHFSGYTLDAENYQSYVAANGFVVVIFDKIYAVARNWYLNR